MSGRTRRDAESHAASLLLLRRGAPLHRCASESLLGAAPVPKLNGTQFASAYWRFDSAIETAGRDAG